MQENSVPDKTLQVESETEPSADEICGIGRFKPKWLQRFADPKVYLIIFCAVGVVEGAYYTYFIGVLSTLEKRFAFESKISGIILIADNFSAAVISLIVGYYGGNVHKPRMMAFGMVLVCFSSFLSALPYFMYGPATHFLSRDSPTLGDKQKEYCSSVPKEEDCGGDENSAMFPAVFLLFTANFINGFGYTAYYTIGTPYLDDNVKKKNSPMYLSAMGALRIFGPALGFFLASVCLKFYEDPFYDPGIDPDNPRWVGAWWMGFLILGFILFIFTLLLALFPRRLPQRFRSEETEDAVEDVKDRSLPKLKDFPQEMKRLFKNPILVCLMISSTFQVNGFLGYFIFMPKYMESQYQKSAADASLFSGATGIVFMLAGILLGGAVIMKYKPRPRYLTGYMVAVEILAVFGFFVSVFLGCPFLEMPGTNMNADETTLNLYNECNDGCSCTLRVFEPVCGRDGTTYFSPCFAGCSNSTSAAAVTTVSPTVSNQTIFDNCMCISGGNNTFETSSVTSGFCSSTCNMFIIYIVLLCIDKFISSTARVGNTLITFRCVDAKDKSFALGAFGSILALLAFLPGPLIYGAIIDSTCLVWEEKCSNTGNCWLYDSDKFRYYLHGVTMLLISVGILFDVVVFFLSDRLVNFYGEGEEKKTEDGDAIVEVLAEEQHMGFRKSTKRSSLVRMDSWL